MFKLFNCYHFKWFILKFLVRLGTWFCFVFFAFVFYFSATDDDDDDGITWSLLFLFCHLVKEDVTLLSWCLTSFPVWAVENKQQMRRSSHVAPQFKITWQKQKQHIYVTRYVLATLKKAEICWCLLNVRQHWIKYWWHIMYKSDTKTGEIEFFNGIYI